MRYTVGSRVQKIRRLRPKHSLLLVSIVAATLLTSVASADISGGPQVNNWWPLTGAHLAGVQPVKADLVGHDVNTYDMFWSVDNGQRNPMSTDYTDSPHKEAAIDFSNWTWRGAGPYALTYTAMTPGGDILGINTINVYVEAANVTSPSVLTETRQLTSAPHAAGSAPGITASILHGSLYVPSGNNAQRQAAAWRLSRPHDASIMERLGSSAMPTWFGDWNRDVEQDARMVATAARQSGTIPVMVAYNIPARDCGGHSAGGSASSSGYSNWIRSFANGIGTGPAIVILEPDALNSLDCLSADSRSQRFQLLSEAVGTLKQQAGTRVYIDAGHPRWHTAAEVAPLLAAANIARADGFSLNISNFISTDENIRYGSDLSGRVQGKHFVIDTSRNGAGPAQDNQWCNPGGRSLGSIPTTETNHPLVDAFLWVKVPGESDGACGGGPAAGEWWPEYALDLAKQAGW